MRHHWAIAPDGVIFCIECGHLKPHNFKLADCDNLVKESESHDWAPAQMSEGYICRRCGEFGIWNQTRIVPANNHIIICSEKIMNKVLE